ncbi:MAG TPA: ABC transporter ATP-binding protein, partial [Thermoproteota archaeon]|nr:ABC transporter ATP-binding protein [Thermoproteota archaeon]
MPSIIQTDNLTKVFGGKVRAVDSVSFEVERGEIFGLLGPNGAGKSTLIRMLCTLSRPTSGTARVAGFDIVNEANEVRKHIGLVAEKMILYNHLTAYENLMLFGKLHDIPDETLGRRIDELLELVQMTRWRNSSVGDFSTGMKQRINVIRGLLHMPELLFLDEPTLGLDPQSSLEIRELVRRLNQEQGITVILTTHYMDEADALSDRIALIHNGKIAALDTPAELKKRISGSDAIILQLKVSNLTPELVSGIKSLVSVTDVLSEDATELKIYGKGKDAIDDVIDEVRSKKGEIAYIRNIEPTL